MKHDGMTLGDEAARQISELVNARKNVAPTPQHRRPSNFRQPVPNIVFAEIYGSTVSPAASQGEIKILHWVAADASFQPWNDANPLPFYCGHLPDAEFEVDSKHWFIWRSDRSMYIPLAPPTNPSEAATIRWKNTDSTTCPPYGIIEIIGAGTDGDGDFYIGRRPSRSSDTSITRSTRRSKVFYVNGPTEVETFDTDNFGVLEIGSPFRAAYNTSDGTPTAGDTWGPEYDSWLLQKEQSGFVALGGDIDDAEDPADNTALFARPTNDSFFHANFLNGAYEFEAYAGVQDIPISELVNVSHLRDFERDEDGWFVCLNPGRYLIACTLAFVDGTDEPGLHFTPFEPILSGFIYLRAGAGDPPANRTRVQTFVRGAGFYLQTYNSGGDALDRYQNNQPTSVSSSCTAFLEAGERVGITFEASPETAWTLIVTGSLWAIRLE